MKPLPPRRRQVLVLVARGYTNAQIGRQLGITERTVNRHLAETYAVLGARDRANAVAIALVTGLLEAEDVGMPRPAVAVEARQEAVDGPQGVQEPARGVRDVRGSAEASQGRTGPRGEAAA